MTESHERLIDREPVRVILGALASLVTAVTAALVPFDVITAAQAAGIVTATTGVTAAVSQILRGLVWSPASVVKRRH